MPAPVSATAHDLIAAARAVVRSHDPDSAGLWPRAASLLGRQAIDTAMRELWGRRAPGLEHASWRCQLLCLPEFLGDAELAGRAHAAWEGLSRGCHVRVYELAPSAAELGDWLSCAGELADAVVRAVSPVSG